MSKVKELKDLIKHEVFHYTSELEQTLPVDDEGNIRSEYLSYVSLHTMHNLIESISRDVAHIIIEKLPGKDDEAPTVKAIVDSSFYVVGNGVFSKILELLNEIEELEEHKPTDEEEDFNASL